LVAGAAALHRRRAIARQGDRAANGERCERASRIANAIRIRGKNAATTLAIGRAYV
jgi:hypothetical protein